jgi:hypothetical protein
MGGKERAEWRGKAEKYGHFDHCITRLVNKRLRGG